MRKPHREGGFGQRPADTKLARRKERDPEARRCLSAIWLTSSIVFCSQTRKNDLFKADATVKWSHSVSQEAIRHGNGHACKSSFLEHRGPVKGLSLGIVEMTSLFKDLVPKSPSRVASNAVQISFHTNLHSGDRGQKWPLRSGLTGRWGSQQILRVKSPCQGPAYPASFFSQEIQSKQK